MFVRWTYFEEPLRATILQQVDRDAQNIENAADAGHG